MSRKQRLAVALAAGAVMAAWTAQAGRAGQGELKF
jgi:hypothetical protein